MIDDKSSLYYFTNADLVLSIYRSCGLVWSFQFRTFCVAWISSIMYITIFHNSICIYCIYMNTFLLSTTELKFRRTIVLQAW